MSYRGDFVLNSTFDFKFSTIDAGIPTSVSGAFVAAYPDNSTTEITAGLVFSSDFDSRVGLNNVRVVASSANGYVTGSNYDIVVISGTVGGKSLVGYVVGAFSIQARSAIGGGSSSSSDPWSTVLPGAYSAGQAGHTLASRMPTGTVLVGDKTGFSLSSPQSFNLIGNISGTLSRVIDLTNAGSAAIADGDMSTIAGRVWNSQYAPVRTLTTSAGDSIPPAAGDDVFAIRGDTFIWNISGLDLGNLSKIQFSVKKKINDADSESLIFVESGTGLMYIDGVPATASNGAITYSQVSGTAQIRVEAQETAKLDVAQNLYDIQIIRTTGTYVSSPVQGNFYVTWDSSRATS